MSASKQRSDEREHQQALSSMPQPVQQSKTTSVHPPSMGRFVTRRRRGAAIKPKLPKAIISILNSSDDFTSAAFCSSSIFQPSKRRRRRVPPAVLLSSAENSVNAGGTSSYATNILREISLNESADHSLDPAPGNPSFALRPQQLP
ncbi:serine/threonine-protein kinase haspin [Lates japonicus]|uniref:Serine/threonine-protein kinase haspin n=1 Tax=Lates japonicus TaxID=270547 RepID=A0AAD3NHU0_LATJO|nr:serine/threonine-protein kinase haspin [Lates japonicus]